MNLVKKRTLKKIVDFIPHFLLGVPMLVFATMHFIKVSALSMKVPLSVLPEFMVVLTGILLWVGGLSILFKYKEEVVTFWLGILIISFAFTVQLPEILQGVEESLPHFGKDSALGGALLLLSRLLKENRQLKSIFYDQNVQ
ncbi:hypothetical protein WIW50_05060 [Flavobacteriaceae bacterium 3-367]